MKRSVVTKKDLDQFSEWKWVKLKEISDSIQYGYTESSSQKQIGPKFLRITDIQENKVDWDAVPYCKIDNETKKRYLLKDGDLVFARTGATVGKSFLIKGKIPEAVFASYLIRVRVNAEINEKYLSNFFHSTIYWSQITDGQIGIGQPNVNGTKLGQLNLPLPTLKTQQLIVSKIEELFSELDKGIENLKTAQQQLKTYRQSVLKWAFVNDRFENYILKDVTEKIQIGPFGTQLHKEDYIENGIPLINPTHIKDGLIVADYSFSILKEKRDSLPNYILKTGDVIMGRRGEMGRCGLVSKKEDGWFCGTGSLYFRPDSKKVDSVFLYYNLRSEPVKKYLDENAGGTTMANLNLKIVNNIPISLPSIKEQRNIVLEIERRLSVADKMEDSINQSLQQSVALRQSILKKAFEGKLV